MKSIFFGFLFLTKIAFSATYFVDNVGGNDANSGISTSTPWKTLTKVQAKIFAPDDVVSFKCGGRFSGTTISGKGNITFNSYGTGARPVIDGQSTRICFELSSINVTFNGLKIVNGQPNNISLWRTTYITIESCNVDSSKGHFFHNANIYSGLGSHLTIRNSSISFGEQKSGGGNLGIYIDGTDNVLMEYDTLDGNLTNLRIGFGTTAYGDYRDTLSSDHTNHWTDGLIIRYCVCKNSVGGEIGDDGSYNAQFYYNVFESPKTFNWHDIIFLHSDGGGGYNMFTCIGAKYYNNTFILHQRSCFLEISPDYQVITDSITFKNNIFYYDSPKSPFIYHHWGTPLKTFVFENNLWYSTNSKHTWEINGKSTSTFSTWQRWGFDRNGFYTNPLFTNYATGDYSLKSGSPAINSGTFVGLTKDIHGNQVPQNSPDIGAFQHLKLE
jgi:hypothetical protein